MSKYFQHDCRLIIGKNCLAELIRHAPDRLVKIYTSKTKNDDLLDIINRQSLPFEVVSKDHLEKMAESTSHQGFAAVVKEKPTIDLKKFLQKDRDKSLVLMLDSIFDPQNLGTLLRAAECFGVDAVIWSKNRGASLSPVACKASVGASELVDTILVSNLADTAQRFQNEFYSVVACNVSDKAESLETFRFQDRTLLILGSEGAGIQPLLLKRADHELMIPMKGKISSLNVSQAASVILSHWK